MSYSTRIRREEHEHAAHAERAIASWGFVMALVFALAVLVSGCVPAEAIKHAREQHAINVGYTKASDATPLSISIGEAGADAWAVQGYTLDGTRLPVETVERLRARGELPEGYKP